MTATAGTGAAPDYQQIVAAVRDEFETLNRYLGSLAPERWHGPTACTEWNLTKLVSHLGSGAVLVLRMIRSGLEGTPPQTQEERQQKLANAEFLMGSWVTTSVTLTEDDFRAAPHLKLVQLMSAGYEHIDLDLAARYGVPVAHFGGSNADARAELAGTVFELDLEGRNRRRIALVVSQDGVTVADPGQSNHRATLWLTGEAFVRLAAGRFPLEAAERNGELAVDGDRQAALKLNALFPGY